MIQTYLYHLRWRCSRRTIGILRIQSPAPRVSLRDHHRYYSKPKDPSESDESSSSAPRDDSQFYKHWLKQLRSPPNLITLSRIASAPLLSYLIVTNHHGVALIGCVFSGLSDVLDGYLAKHHQMSTVLGTYLDPLADKILINVLSVSLWYTGTLPAPLVVLWMVRDVALAAGCYIYVARNTASGMNVTDPLTTPLKINPTLSSKANTAFQFATLSVGILYPIYPIIFSDALTGLCWISSALTVSSGFSYLGYSAFSESGNQKQSKRNTSDRR